MTAWELDAGRHPGHPDHRQHGRLLHARGARSTAVVVGADRIAANGDTANKIGTYTRGRAGQGARHPVLRRRADLDHRPRRWPTAAASPSRSAARDEVTAQSADGC
ncbi:MAG: hypothetical protein MZV65_53305 [Chromatiales bacterium]|nr:hypothetical protein [Chromatiales bacterium]